MSKLAANETRRQLRYNFTDTERIDKAKALAESLNRYGSTEAELARVKKDYASRLDSIQAEIDLLNGAVLSGYELREYLCFFAYDDPKPGRKTLRKREGGEIVGEEDMTEADRQMVMEILDAQAAEAGDGKPALALTDYQMPEDASVFDLTEEQRSSFEFGDSICDVFAEQLHRIFISPANSFLLSPRDRDKSLAEFFAGQSDGDIANFGAWLREDPRPSIPGVRWLIDAIAAYERGLEIERAKANARAAAEKKEARKGRRASGPGTVDIPADEGSRDDAGPDSKNNL